MRPFPCRARRARSAAAVAALAILAGCGSTPTPSAPSPGVGVSGTRAPSRTPAVQPSPPPTPTPAPAAGCAALVDSLSLPDRVGQLLMVGVNSAGVAESDLAVLAATRAGSVLLLGNTDAGVRGVRATAGRIRSATRRPRGVAAMLAADQEGGLVQRLSGPGFDRIPAATEQANWSDGTLRRRAAGWGRQLRRAGIDADLAPVADVVPQAMVPVNQPIGLLRRGYGPRPRTVADKVRAFVAGMDRSGVATAVKHFPGLGRVRGNTDFASRVTDATTTRDDPALAGFRAAVDSQVDLVMVSSAYYSRIDSRRRAAFSPTVIRLLRRDLGFAGVVVSDDLSAAAMSDLAPGTRATRFVAAGGDLAIVGNPAQARAMARALVQRAEDDPAFARRVRQSATRVVDLKARRGMARC